MTGMYRNVTVAVTNSVVTKRSTCGHKKVTNFGKSQINS